jgi:hypothetical protein
MFNHHGCFVFLAGDRYVQIDFGPQELDLALRVRVHCLQQALESSGVSGLVHASVQRGGGSMPAHQQQQLTIGPCRRTMCSLRSCLASSRPARVCAP